MVSYGLHGVKHNAELYSAKRCTPGSLTPRYDAYRGVWLLGMMHTAESYSAVGCTLLSFLRYFVVLSLWCDAHHRVQPCGMLHTAESDSTVWRTRGVLTSQHDAHPGVWSHGGMHTVEFLKNSNISAIFIKCFSLFGRGTDGFKSWKK